MPSASIRAVVRRILDRIEYAELHEPNLHFQCDYRIAWITVLYADQGYSQPAVAACYAVLGLHPDKVWPAIVARRKAFLGALYEEFWGEASSPKKPCQSVRVVPEKVRREDAA